MTLIRLNRAIAGQFHSVYWDLVDGDVVDIDSTNGVRYATTGLATVVRRPSDVEAHWASLVPEGQTACRHCRRFIDPGEPWVVRDDEMVGGGHLWRRPEHAACV